MAGKSREHEVEMPHFTDEGTETEKAGDVAQVMPCLVAEFRLEFTLSHFQCSIPYTTPPRQSQTLHVVYSWVEGCF